jgi:hypothetical protein
MVRHVLGAMRLMPAFGFVLLALGWVSMVLLGHFPASEWAWRLTVLANSLMANLFHYSDQIMPLTVPGQIALCLGFTGLFMAAAFKNWLKTGFVLSHMVAVALFFGMVQVNNQSASLSGDAAGSTIGLQPDAAAGSLIIFAMVVMGCVSAHFDLIAKARGRRVA